jgi:imidazolonepropionase
VKATRLASLEELVEQSRPRLQALMRGGATTVEIKSGYGLDTPTEMKMLEAARALGRASEAVRVVPTLLALHALPPEYKERREEFVAMVLEDMLPSGRRGGPGHRGGRLLRGHRLHAAEVRALFEAAAEHGLRVKLHAEQLSNLEGAALAAEFGALSADHLEHADEAGIAAMAKAGMVAVLLPGAFYALREEKKPPVDLLRRYGVPMAVATDCNPGTSPMLSLPLILSMACTLFRLTPEEALAGVTVHAAKALGLEAEIGTVTPGKAADLCIWRIARPAELCYWIGHPGPERRIVAGVDRRRLPRRQRVDEIAAAVAAPARNLLPLDDREGRIDIADVVAPLRRVGGIEHAVEDEIQRIELGAEAKAPVLVPHERRQHLARRVDMAHVAGKGREIVRRVAKFEYRLANDLGGRFGAERAVVAGGGNDGELFDNEPIEVLALNLLTCQKVVHGRIEVGREQRKPLRIGCICPGINFDERQCVSSRSARNNGCDHRARIGRRCHIFEP